MNFNHDYTFSTVQNCIRWDDIYDEKIKTSRLESDNKWKYLGIFEMADLGGMIALAKRTDPVQLQRMQTKILTDLLTDLGIRKDQIYPSYHAGGNVKDLTKGKYDFDYNVPADEMSKRIFLEQGILERNIIPDKERDTFLAVKLQREDPRGKNSNPIPTPWGYRNEININIGTGESPTFVDIGTIERLVWKPSYDRNNKLIELNEIQDETSIGAVGLERLCMVANGLDRVQDVDYIKPFYETLGNIEKKELVGESLRALHRIYADIKKYDLDMGGKNRRRRVNRILRTITNSNLEQEDISRLLKINAENQPWHPELADSTDYALQEIKQYRGRRK
jgi:hypothetical protein